MKGNSPLESGPAHEDIDQLVGRFLQDLERQETLPQTRAAYRLDLLHFASWFARTVGAVRASGRPGLCRSTHRESGAEEGGAMPRRRRQRPLQIGDRARSRLNRRMGTIDTIDRVGDRRLYGLHYDPAPQDQYLGMAR